MASRTARLNTTFSALGPSILRFQHRSNPRVVLSLLAGLVLVLGFLDYLTGPVVTLTVFYLIPTALATILVDRRAGVIIGVESAIVSSISLVVSSADYDGPGVVNGAMLLVTLMVIVVLVGAVRENALAATDEAGRRRDFLTFAAHQLRTPLAGIRASTDALLVTGATPQQERLLANISHEAERTGRLMTSLLRMAHLDEGGPPVLHEQDIAELCREEAGRLRLRAGIISVRVDTAAAPSHPLLASAEGTREALANLLDNARRHARTEVTVTVVASPASVEIRVGDDGPGLPPARASRVFDPFVSLDGKGGSGLGLPIARRLVEMQGGRLTYEHQQFVIHLPNRTAERAQPATRSVRRGGPEPVRAVDTAHE